MTGAVLWRAGQRATAVFAGAAAVGSTLLASGLKLLWQPARPDREFVRVSGEVDGYSFPSGHTLFAVTFYGFLFSWVSTFVQRGRVRTVLLWFLGLLIALMGPARVLLGHLWASDGLASYALGFAILFLLIRAYEALRFRAAAFEPVR